MSKYEALSRYLEMASENSFETNFSRIEAILGFALPQSAYRHQAWWANETHGSHSHSRSWQEAGWETCQVNTARKTVRFERKRAARKPVVAHRQASLKVRPEAGLLREAMDLSGIGDEQKVVNAALTLLIQREAGRRLAALGGTMPDAWAPERRRQEP